MSRHQCDGPTGEDNFGNERYPCGGEFLCPGCERVVGYCCGCGDDLGELCDDCAVAVWDARRKYTGTAEREPSHWRHPEAR